MCVWEALHAAGLRRGGLDKVGAQPGGESLELCGAEDVLEGSQKVDRECLLSQVLSGLDEEPSKPPIREDAPRCLLSDARLALLPSLARGCLSAHGDLAAAARPRLLHPCRGLDWRLRDRKRVLLNRVLLLLASIALPPPLAYTADRLSNL